MTLAQTWNDLRLKNQLCDGVLKTVDGSEFPVHRVILSAFSPFFRAYFTNSLNNGKPELTEMIIYDIPPEIIRVIIEFAYTQTCQITSENVFPLMVAADKLSCIPLVNFCNNFVFPTICAVNCIAIYKFAGIYFFKALQDRAWESMCRNVEQVINTPSFLCLTLDELKRLLEDENLNVKCEETVFDAVQRWVYADPGNRRHGITQLLPCIRFGSVSFNYFTNVIRSFPYYTKESNKFLETVDYLFDKSEESYYYRYCHFNPRVPDEVIFTLGGWCEGMPSDAVETYDKRSDSWYLTNLRDPKTRAYHGVVVLDNLIYVVGGFDASEFFSDMHCLDPTTGTWTEKACMHESRCYISVCTLGNEIYAMGGYNGRTRLKSVEKYNPSLNQWTMITPMNVVRSDAHAAALDNKIFIAGGYNGSEVLSSVERYCPRIDQWDFIHSMSSPRSGVGLIAHGNYIYAVGGFDGINRLKTVERYNIWHNRWEIIADMRSCRSNMATVIMDDSIYVIGGFNGDASAGNSTIRYTEVYDEQRNTWFDVSPLNLNRSALSACVCRSLPNMKKYTYAGIVNGEDSEEIILGI